MTIQNRGIGQSSRYVQLQPNCRGFPHYPVLLDIVAANLIFQRYLQVCTPSEVWKRHMLLADVEVAELATLQPRIESSHNV